MSNKQELKNYLKTVKPEGADVIQELNEQEVLDLVNSKKDIVLKVWMDNCGFCAKYEPIYELAANKFKDPAIVFAAFKINPKETAGSEFAKLYMTQNGQERMAAPATLLFTDGKLKSRHYGLMSAPDLEQFLLTGESPTARKEAAHKELSALFLSKGELITMYEKLPEMNKRIDELLEILKK